jgi:hypothetical protein
MVQLDVNTDVEFDFEAFVQKELLPVIEKGGSSLNTFGLASSFGKGSDPKRRTVVCRHWLIGLCQKVTDDNMMKCENKEFGIDCCDARTTALKYDIF